MRTVVALVAALAVAPLALAQEAPDAAAPTKEFIVYLHEPLHVAPDRIVVDVGDEVRINVRNYNPNPHDLMVCGGEPDLDSSCSTPWGFTTVDPMSEANLTFTAAKAGTFEYYCTIAGHKQGGMRGELVVRGDAQEKETPGVPLLAVAAVVGLAAALIARRP